MSEGTVAPPTPVVPVKITWPPKDVVLVPGQLVAVEGTGENLVWGIDRLGDGLPDFDGGSGRRFWFIVPHDSTADQLIRIKLTGKWFTDQQTHKIIVPGDIHCDTMAGE